MFHYSVQIGGFKQFDVNLTIIMFSVILWYHINKGRANVYRLGPFADLNHASLSLIFRVEVTGSV
jgi:hypothetical protein